MIWESIGEAKLDVPTPTELPLDGPTQGWPHATGAAAGNRRAAMSLGYARTTRFTCELPEGPPILSLLALGDRVLAVRAPDPAWGQNVELIDGEGGHVRTIEGSHGDWALDLRHAMLLGRTPKARFGAWSLDEPSARRLLVFNRVNGRELDILRWVDDTLVVVTHQAKSRRGPPPDVLVDVLSIPGYDDLSRWGSLRSRTHVAERNAEGLNRVVVGFDPAGLILANERELWWGDWHLRERGRLELGSEVLPLQVAPRSDGSSWMLTEREGRTELWQIAVGRCEQAFVLDPGLVDGVLSVASDDGVVITSSSVVASHDADGRQRWSFARDGAATGLMDSHGVALYSDGGALISTDLQGARATVWTAPDGVGRLGPLAATATQMWVGAGRFVFGLR